MTKKLMKENKNSPYILNKKLILFKAFTFGRAYDIIFRRNNKRGELFESDIKCRE